MFRTFAYFRGAYLYRRIKGFLLEIFDEVDRKDVKLSGELIDGASFTLLNLTMRTELLGALRFPLVLKSGTIGRLSIAGLDAVASRSGKVVVTLSDVTFVFALPDPNSSSGKDSSHPTPELLVAARRTLLELMSHSAVAAWPDSMLGSFLTTGLGAAEWKEVDGQSKGKKAKKPLTSKQAAAAKAKASAAAAEAALERHKWMEYAMQSVQFVIQNLHVRVEHRNEGGHYGQSTMPSPQMAHNRNVPAARTVAAVGLTLPSLRIRPTELERLLTEPPPPPHAAASANGQDGSGTSTSSGGSSTGGSRAGRNGGEAVARRLVTCSNLALYCDPAAASYLDALRPQPSSSTAPRGAQAHVSASTSAHPASADTATTAPPAAVSEGARCVAWLRHRWVERHDGLIFPFTASLLATFLLAPAPDLSPTTATTGSATSTEIDSWNSAPRVPTIRCDQVELQLGSVRGCVDAAQLTALAEGVNAVHLFARRERNAAFLVPMPPPASLLTEGRSSRNSESSSSSRVSSRGNSNNRIDGSRGGKCNIGGEEEVVHALSAAVVVMQHDDSVWWREQLPPQPPPLPPAVPDTCVLPLPAAVEPHPSDDQQGTLTRGVVVDAPAVAWLKRAHQNHSSLSVDDNSSTAVVPSATSPSSSSSSSTSSAVVARQRSSSSIWTRAAWQWALRCVLADLRPWLANTSSGSSWGRWLTHLRAFRRAVNLYKARHRQQLHNAPTSAAAATVVNKSNSSSDIGSSSNDILSESNHSTKDGGSGAVDVDPFVVDLGSNAVLALHLFDVPFADSSEEWELAMIELIALPLRDVLLARSVARLELVVERRRALGAASKSTTASDATAAEDTAAGIVDPAARSAGAEPLKGGGVGSELSLRESAILTSDLIAFASNNAHNSQHQGQAWRCRSLLPASVWLPPDTDVPSSISSKSSVSSSETSSILSMFGTSTTSSTSCGVVHSTGSANTSSTTAAAAAKSNNRWLTATMPVGKVSLDAATFGFTKSKNKGSTMTEQKSLLIGSAAAGTAATPDEAHKPINPLRAPVNDDTTDRACAAVLEMFPKLDLSVLRNVVMAALERAAERGFEAGGEIYDTALAEVIELAMADAISEMVEMPQEDQEDERDIATATSSATSGIPSEATSIDTAISDEGGFKKSTGENNCNADILPQDSLVTEQERRNNLGDSDAEGSTVDTLDTSPLNEETQQEQHARPAVAASAPTMELVELRNRAKRLATASKDASRDAAIALTAVEAASRAAEMAAKVSTNEQASLTEAAEEHAAQGQNPNMSDGNDDALLSAAAAGVAAATEAWCAATAHAEACQAEAARAAEELAVAEVKVAAPLAEEALPSQPLLPSAPPSATPATTAEPTQTAQTSESMNTQASSISRRRRTYPWVRQVRLAADSAHLELRTTAADSFQNVRAPLLRVGFDGVTFGNAEKPAGQQQQQQKFRKPHCSLSSAVGIEKKESFRCTVAHVEVLQWLTSEADPTVALRHDDDVRRAALVAEQKASLAAAAAPLIEAALAAAAAQKDVPTAATTGTRADRSYNGVACDGSSCSSSSRGDSKDGISASLSSSRSEISELLHHSGVPAQASQDSAPVASSTTTLEDVRPLPAQMGQPSELPRGVSVEAAQMGGPVLLENCGSKRLLFAAGGKLKWQAGVGCLSPGQRCAKGQDVCLTWELVDAPHHPKHARSAATAVHPNSAGSFVLLNSGSRRKLYASNFRPSSRLFRHEVLPTTDAADSRSKGSPTTEGISSRVRVRRFSGNSLLSSGSSAVPVGGVSSAISMGTGSDSDEKSTAEKDEGLSASLSTSAVPPRDGSDSEASLAQTAAVWAKHVGCGAPDARATTDNVWRFVPSDRPPSNASTQDSTSSNGHQGPRYFIVNAESERYLFARPVRRDPHGLQESYGALDLGAVGGANSHNAAAAIGFGAVGSRASTATAAAATEGSTSFGQPATDPYLEWQLVLPSTHAAAAVAVAAAEEGQIVNTAKSLTATSTDYRSSSSSKSRPVNMGPPVPGANLIAPDETVRLPSADAFNATTGLGSDPARAAATAAAVPEPTVEPSLSKKGPPSVFKTARPLLGDATVLMRSGCTSMVNAGSSSSRRTPQPAFFAVDFEHTPGSGRKRGRWSITATPQDLEHARLEGGVGPRLHTLFTDPERLADPNLLPESDDDDDEDIDEDDDEDGEEEEEGEEWDKKTLESDPHVTSSRRLPAVMVAADERRKLEALEKVLAAAGRVWTAGDSFTPLAPAVRVPDRKLKTPSGSIGGGLGSGAVEDEQANPMVLGKVRTPLQFGDYDWARWLTQMLTNNDLRVRVATPTVLLRIEKPLAAVARGEGSCEEGEWHDEDREEDDEDDEWWPAWGGNARSSAAGPCPGSPESVAVSTMRLAPVHVEAQQRNCRLRVRVHRSSSSRSGGGCGGRGGGISLELPLAEIDVSDSRVHAARAVEAALAAAFPRLDLGAVLGKSS